MAYEIKYRSDNEMKDSGIEWLGKIPKEWEVTRIKFISNIYGRIGFRGYTTEDIVGEGEGAITLSPSNIDDQKLDLSNKTYISWKKYNESPEIKIYNNDILLVKTASIGKVAYIERLFEPATINPQFVVFKNIKTDRKLFYYNLISEVIQQQVMFVSNGGVISTLTQKDIGDFYISNLDELNQQKIANFLDIKTAEFDTIISKKEQLIEKLEAAKKSLISEVVTGKVKIVDGELVDRKPEEMKDSGVEWLGMIPKDWEVKRINLITSNVGDGLHGTPIYEEGTKYFFINGNNLRNGKIIIDSSTKEVEKKEYNKYKKNLSENTILMSINGTIGNLAMYNGEKIILGKSAAYINLLKNINIQFIYYYFQSKEIEIYFNRSMSGTTINNLSLATIRKTSVVLPREEEMSYIVGYLDKRTSELELIIAKTKQQITKLKEAKQSLISEAVTGKIDLRDWEIIETGGR